MRLSAVLPIVLLGTLGGVAHADPPSEGAKARTEIDATLVQMKAVSRRVRDELRDVRRHGTKAQIACLDEALSRADVAFRSARASGDDALAAYARGDLDDARQARQRVSELRDHQRIAARDGAACTSPAPLKPIIVAERGTTVRVIVDPKIPPAPKGTEP